MKNTTAETILYYENFADSYVNETINCNFTDIEKKFCKYVKPGGNVWDVVPVEMQNILLIRDIRSRHSMVQGQ